MKVDVHRQYRPCSAVCFCPDSLELVELNLNCLNALETLDEFAVRTLLFSVNTLSGRIDQMLGLKKVY